MTNSNSTKRALLTSVLAIFMCVAMLIGTTFAWFTDTASTSVNTIQAGTLDVALEVADGTNTDGTTNWVSAEGKVLDFVKVAGHENEEILWEPGCTYNLPKLRIVNNGNLALKYKVIITGINGDAELNDVINWTIDGISVDKEKSLAAKGTDEFTISGTMDTATGNQYMGMKIEGISITVYATQDTIETDSNNNQYDKDATYAPVANVTALADKNVSVAPWINQTGTPYTLDTAYVFATTETADEANAGNYAKYHADFVVSADKDVAANSLMLAGYYSYFCGNDGSWIGLKSDNDVKAGEEIRLLQSLLNGRSMNYSEICNDVKEFKCGAVALDESVKGTTLNVELRLYEIKKGVDSTSSVDSETGDYIVIGNYSYTF